MIIYFADRRLNILGMASTKLPDGLTIIDDKKTEDVETGVAEFECYIPFDDTTRNKAEECTKVGNYVLRSHNGKNEFYTIIESEADTKKREVYVYAEDAGLDLLNEVVGEYTADQAYPIDHYINKFAYDSGFVVGINEASGLTRKLSWDGETTVTERLASVATQFDSCEISYSFDIKGLVITNKYINIYKKRGQYTGVQLRLNKEIDSIVTKSTIANLATALKCTGGTPENAEKPITLSGYSYDDGDFYVDGDILKCRSALQKWSRYIWPDEPNQTAAQGHIVRTYSYDTTSQQTLCAHAVTKLKSICDMEVNFEVDIKTLPDNVRIGDRVNIVDDDGGLYLESRILKLEESVVNNEYTATIGENLIKNSGISSKVEALADQFAEQAEANRKAAEEAAAAQKAAQEAQAKADQAQKDLENAQAEAAAAQAAADEAQAKADAAAEAAAQAKADAAAANAAVEVAQSAAETATTKAAEAQSTADAALSQATDAKSTADAAKLDATAAQEDINNLGTQLETVSNTMQADYARKTDLTEATADLQTQISQNAAEISSTASKVQTIDETVNNAAEQAAEAKTTAENAQTQAAAAAADAAAAQTAADEAVAAAASAQSNADTAAANAQAAQTAADEAKNKADAAQSDLDAAKANLDAVSAKADATEAEVAAAQQAVVDAQAAADQAAADAADAQAAANTAKTAADNAQSTADAAAAKAKEAQDAADALAVRMTTAETNITQNAENIDLCAKKTEVTETLGGYYTKEEADAAINVKAGEITQEVNQTISNINYDNRNYALKSGNYVADGETGWQYRNENMKNYYSISVNDGYTRLSYTNAIKSSTYRFKMSLSEPIVFGYKYTLSMRVRRNSAFVIVMAFAGSTYKLLKRFADDLFTPDTWVDLTYTFKIDSASSDINEIAIDCDTSNTNYASFENAGDYIDIAWLKLEKGEKATKWEPAPEDIDASVKSLGTKITQTAEDLRVDIESAEKVATNYMDFSGEGLCVGDMTAETLGNNALIGGESFKIRRGTDVLADFSADIIELGKKAVKSVISLCGGAGKITAKSKGDENVFDSLRIDTKNFDVYSDDFFVYSGTDKSTDTETREAYGHLSASNMIQTERDGETYYTSITYLSADTLKNDAKSVATVTVEAKDTTNPDGSVYGDVIGARVALCAKRFDGADWTENMINIEPDGVYFDDNDKKIYGTKPDGTTVEAFNPSSSDGNTAIGHGNYSNKDGNTNIYGNDVYIGVASIATPGTHRPYLRKGDSVTINLSCAGWITNGGTDLYFNVPVNVPIIGSPTVSISSVNGFTIRQNNKYLYGGSSSARVKPNSYTCEISGWNTCGIRVTAVFGNTTNVINNSPCGISASIKITLS